MVKLINVSDAAYAELAKRKNGRSFSEVILNLTLEKKKGNLNEFLRIVESGKVDKKELVELEKSVKSLRKDWKRWSTRYV